LFALGGTLVGGPGNDYLSPGRPGKRQGFPAIVDYSASPVPVEVDLGTGVATGPGTDTLVGIESVLGSRFDDRLTAGEEPATFEGRGGSDDIQGGTNPDGDFISGGAGDDIIDAGTGWDTIMFRDAKRSVDVDLRAGRSSGQGDDTMTGFINVIGSPYGGTIHGDDADNLLIASGGATTIYGYGGNDNLQGRGRRGIDTVFAGDGDDLVSLGLGDDTADGGAGDDDITGWSGNDILDGGEGNDEMEAGAGDDRLSGGNGNDILWGGRVGTDILDGGPGVDRCYYGERVSGCEE
jgi:Ca2+-binding RTX toxin-like protein